MLCIVAAIFVFVFAIFSARYRRLVGRAWSCMWHRVTLRPCDTSFREDVKNAILAPVALRAPRLVKPASATIEVMAWITVLTLVVSVYIVGRSGLNFFVYGTCDKQDAQACTLSSESCSIDSVDPAFWESVGQGDVIGAFGNEFSSLGETISAIPSRLRAWDATEHLPANATYLGGYREGLPTAVEVIDPGCSVCAQLYRNVEASGFAQTHNLAYVVYPIDGAFGSKFPHSPLVASYLTAVREFEAQRGGSAGRTGDWYILDQLFAGERPDGQSWQVWLNTEASPDQAEAQLQQWLQDAGYGEAELAQIAELTASDQVAGQLADSRVLVEDEIQTVKVPSLIADGRLHAGLVDVPALEGMD